MSFGHHAADREYLEGRKGMSKMTAEADKIIAAAEKHDLILTHQSFQVIDGELYIDGMDPAEWLDAMTMD